MSGTSMGFYNREINRPYIPGSFQKGYVWPAVFIPGNRNAAKGHSITSFISFDAQRLLANIVMPLWGSGNLMAFIHHETAQS